MTRFVISLLATAAQATDPPSMAARPAVAVPSTGMFLIKAAAPEMLDTRHRAIMNDLGTQKDATAFDRAYVEAQYQAHVETVDMFQAYADKGENLRMKQFAVELLPTLKAHLEQASKVRGDREWR